MELHPLLKRQLRRLELKKNSEPKIFQWNDFLSHVNATYIEVDQDRYTIERSLDISSREMMSMTELLEESQRIAHMGSWYYDTVIAKIQWSKEMFRLLNLDATSSEPDYQQFLTLIHKDERKNFDHLVKLALEEGKEFNIEIRIKTAEKQYRWFHMIGHPIKSSNPTTQYQFPRLSGIVLDIHQRKADEKQLEKLNKQLVETAREVGQFEVASSVLHNVGNVLNSIMVSLTLLKEIWQKPSFKKFISIVGMLKEHRNNLEQFFSELKGKTLLNYLPKLSDTLNNDLNIGYNEIENLEKHLKHIIDVITLQQSASKYSGIQEKFYLSELLGYCIKITDGKKNEESHIEIKRNYSNRIFITTDKSKLLQIMINLIQNAREALNFSDQIHKKIDIIANQKDHQIQIDVIDNGIGIDKDNLDRIFSFGYTTKKAGHGFGLHYSALAAAELGGQLQVKSAGIGKGSQFTLTIPATHSNKGTPS